MKVTAPLVVFTAFLISGCMTDFARVPVLLDGVRTGETVIIRQCAARGGTASPQRTYCFLPLAKGGAAPQP